MTPRKPTEAVGWNDRWQTVYGVNEIHGVIGAGEAPGLEVVELEARRIPEGWIVRRGCTREFFETAKLHETRDAAEHRMAELRAMSKTCAGST